ncbi:MAG TPA: hypothetical protein VFP84_09310 [Kofleriaceae bacterium]|nr:hypothetical protein [Kofleriaceae bacterium]
MTLAVACLGWGSLIWKPANHPGAPLEAHGVRAGLVEAGGTWHDDGPDLPLELARSTRAIEADELYPSWVLLPGSPASTTLWAPLDLPEEVGTDRDRALLHAARALATREGTDVSRIGRWPIEAAASAETEIIAAWADEHRIDAVVWTALPPRWHDAERAPTLDEVLALLRDLAARKAASHAEQYIRATPRQITSPFRAAIERELGWTPR